MTLAQTMQRTLAGAAALAKKGKRLQDVVSTDVVNDIFACALKKQTGVSLKYMLDFGSSPFERQMILSGKFLHDELPIRLAHRVAELENLPYGLSTKGPIQKVRDMYVHSFQEIRAVPQLDTAQDGQQFTDLLRRIYERHTSVVPLMAQGVIQLREELRVRGAAEKELTVMPEIHRFLDGFYMSRIGIRMLIGQHTTLSEKQQQPHHIGLINIQTSPIAVAKEAVADARDVCLREYGTAPDVEIYGAPNLTFPYVPGHLHHMLFELIKNSLRAVQDRFEDSDNEPPPVRIVIAEGVEDITIKVSDEGGGIPRSGLAKIWTYLYTTAKSPVMTAADDDVDDVDSQQAMPAVLAGYGYGLPISRLYARYFGGDLQIISMEGYGTDAYLHLCRLGDKQEPLP